MEFTNFLSIIAMPLIIFIIILNGIADKKNVFDLFILGAKEGMMLVKDLFPTLLGLFFAIGLLRGSGVLDILAQLFTPITSSIGIPKEVMPLALIKPISGSASTAIATDIMKTFGVDSFIGLVTSTFMGSTETTIYIIAIYTGIVKIKKTRHVLLAGILGDVLGLIISSVIWQMLV